MTHLKFEMDVDTWVTREGDPDDRWDRASTDGSVTAASCRLTQKDEYNSLPVDGEVNTGDKIWLVWAQYSTGDSFGSDGGQYELCKACKTEVEALAEVDRLQGITDYSVPWNGNFENLDFIKAEEMVVQ
jgi:hypothetical protein